MIAAAPNQGFPRTLVDEADLEGFYRLLRNEAVSFEALMSPHTKATVNRMAVDPDHDRANQHSGADTESHRHLSSQMVIEELVRNALGIFVPIAWQLLRLRTLAREDDNAPARTVLTPLQETVLRRAVKTKLPRRLTARDAMLAVAALGGHLRSNGEPGWLVLGRGFQDLLMLAAGYRLAVENGRQDAINP